MLVALTIKPKSHMSKVSHGLSEAKIKALVRQKLFNNKVRCPKCKMRYQRIVSDRYFCGKCRLKFSLKATLVFKGSKLSFTELWQILQCFLSKLSISQAAGVCSLSEVTVRRWYRKLSGLIPEERFKLKGAVEVDEAFIGRKKYLNQQIVIGGIERSSGHIALACIPDRESGSTDTFLLKHVRQNSLVYTDSHGSYEHITEFFGYGHEVVNHSIGQFGLTNRIENVWMRLRKFIRKTIARAWKEHLPRIIKEFQARVNHPESFSSPISFLTFVPSQLG